MPTRIVDLIAKMQKKFNYCLVTPRDVRFTYPSRPSPNKTQYFEVTPSISHPLDLRRRSLPRRGLRMSRIKRIRHANRHIRPLPWVPDHIEISGHIGGAGVTSSNTSMA
jgi:hypothetical protein